MPSWVPHTSQSTKSMLGRSFIKRCRKDSSGSAAVEFALVALPFIAILLATLEAGLVFFGGMALENAVDQTGRLIRTGQAQAANITQAQMKTDICGKISGIFDCTNNLRLEVKTFPDFASASSYMASAANAALDGSGNLRNDFAFEPASAAGDIVLVRAFLEWNITAAFPGTELANMPNGNRLMSSVTSFRNEPF